MAPALMDRRRRLFLKLAPALPQTLMTAQITSALILATQTGTAPYCAQAPALFAVARLV
jgi:hypothetical protein